MERDQLSESEAENLISEAIDTLHNRLDEGDMPFDLCDEMFDLEPDYLEDLLF